MSRCASRRLLRARAGLVRETLRQEAGRGHQPCAEGGLPPLAPNTQTISPRREGGLEGRGPPGRRQEGTPGLRSPGQRPHARHPTTPDQPEQTAGEAGRGPSRRSSERAAVSLRKNRVPASPWLAAASQAGLCPLGAPCQAPREAGAGSPVPVMVAAHMALPGPPAMGLQPAAPQGLFKPHAQSLGAPLK